MLSTVFAAARQSFKEQEALVYQQLAQLIRDAVWLKSYIAAVMRLEQEAFQSAYASLGPSKATLPLQPEMSAVPTEHMMMATSGAAATRPLDASPQVRAHLHAIVQETIHSADKLSAGSG